MSYFRPLCVGMFALVSTAAPAAEKITFQDHVKPIFREHCVACHSQDDASSGLALDNYGATLGGGAGGEVLAAGDADGSRLWKLITHAEEPKMPPGDKMPAGQLEVIKKWITGGLLDNVGSKPKKAKRSGVEQMVVSKDNRPAGEPAMPEGWFRQPVVSAARVGPVKSLAASPWAPVVAVPWQRQVSLYSVAGGNKPGLLGVLPYPQGSPNVVRFSRDGSLLLVAGGVGARGGSASLFDVKTGERLVTVGDELDAVLAADVSPDHSLIAIGGPKKKVRVYRTSDGELAYEIAKHTDWITALRFSPDGKLLATADRNAGLLLWQATTGNPRADLRGHKGTLTDVAWRADSKVMASTDEAGELRLWRRDGQPVRNFRAHTGGALAVDFARDGRLASAGRDRRVVVWDGAGKAIKRLGPLAEISLSVAFASDGKQLVASDFSGMVQTFDIASGKAANTLAANPPTLAERQAERESERKQIEAKLKPAVERLAAAEKQLKQADAAHANYNLRLAEAQQQVDESKKRQRRVARRVEQLKGSVEKRRQALASAADVHRSAEQALATAKEKLSSSESSDEPGEPADADVTKSLAKAAALAGVAEKKKQTRLKATEAQLSQAEKEANDARKAYASAEKLLATVSSQRSGLPDLGAAQAAFEQSNQAVNRLRNRKQLVSKAIAALFVEQQRYAQALTQGAAQAEKLAAEQNRLAKEAEKSRAKLAIATEQLTKLQAELERQQAKHAELAAATGKLEEQLSAAETAAARAKSRQSDQEAAEQLRAKYLNQ